VEPEKGFQFKISRKLVTNKDYLPDSFKQKCSQIHGLSTICLSFFVKYRGKL